MFNVIECVTNALFFPWHGRDQNKSYGHLLTSIFNRDERLCVSNSLNRSEVFHQQCRERFRGFAAHMSEQIKFTIEAWTSFTASCDVNAR